MLGFQGLFCKFFFFMILVEVIESSSNTGHATEIFDKKTNEVMMNK